MVERVSFTDIEDNDFSIAKALELLNVMEDYLEKIQTCITNESDAEGDGSLGETVIDTCSIAEDIPKLEMLTLTIRDLLSANRDQSNEIVHRLMAQERNEAVVDRVHD